jgi:hypothetical protein
MTAKGANTENVCIGRKMGNWSLYSNIEMDFHMAPRSGIMSEVCSSRSYDSRRANSRRKS